MNPSVDVISQSTSIFDLTDVAVGSRITDDWAGKPAFIWRRSPEMISGARATDLEELVDPIDAIEENSNKDRAMPARDQKRLAGEGGEWVVVIVVCTQLGCVPVGQDSSSV
jgi:ubiquinol-cytochrome c reductase iron-sulfur subunit|tara:strand:- start:1504 stop:1836 length:333 start_codon:yes stop_codon:yes gene_type:complete